MTLPTTSARFLMTGSGGGGGGDDEDDKGGKRGFEVESGVRSSQNGSESLLL